MSKKVIHSNRFRLHTQPVRMPRMQPILQNQPDIEQNSLKPSTIQAQPKNPPLPDSINLLQRHKSSCSRVTLRTKTETNFNNEYNRKGIKRINNVKPCTYPTNQYHFWADKYETFRSRQLEERRNKGFNNQVLANKIKITEHKQLKAEIKRLQESVPVANRNMNRLENNQKKSVYIQREKSTPKASVNQKLIEFCGPVYHKKSTFLSLIQSYCKK